MSYVINLPNGANLCTILDGTIDNTASSLTLVGRNYSGYGEIIAEDLVALLVNFAYGVAPRAPQVGQLWYNTSQTTLQLYNGTAWKNVGSCTSQPSAPSGGIAGDLWWASTDYQLYVYSGTTWSLVGPGYSIANGKSGALWEVLYDTGGNPQPVVSIYLNDTRTAVVSSTTFVSNVSIAGIGTAIKAGYNLSSAYTIYGTANNTSYLGNQPAANYLRNDIDGTISANLTITGSNGLTIGSSSNASAYVSNANLNIKNTQNNGDINFYANVSGTNTLAFNIDGATGTASLLSATLSGSLTLASGASVTGALNVTGTGAYSGNLTAPTQSQGTADDTVATTAWVTNYSGLYGYKIQKNNSWIWVDSASANIVISGATNGNPVFSADVSGVTLGNGAKATTQGQEYNTSGNTLVATTQYVKTATTWWGGSAKFVSNAAPTSGQGNIGDLWFQYAN